MSNGFFGFAYGVQASFLLLCLSHIIDDDKSGALFVFSLFLVSLVVATVIKIMEIDRQFEE